jgi:putative ATP-dependent endonuclease of OLD family
MKIEKLQIRGFRKLCDTEILFGDASFLIGHNNVGKSSVFEALRYILKNEIPTKDDYTMCIDASSGEMICPLGTIVLTATFTNVPDEAHTWLGFRGRIYQENGSAKVKYQKTFSLQSGTKIEMYQQRKELNPSFCEGNKISISTMIRGGIDEALVRGHFVDVTDSQNLTTKAYAQALETFYSIWTFSDEYEWVENPGGIPQNVLSRLPKYILIPAEHRADEINASKNSALGEVMTTIFEDVIESSENYGKVKEYFLELEKEVDTTNEDTKFGMLMVAVNKTIKNIFPDSQIFARVNLSDPNTFLKPNYDIKLGSNILTDVKYQGTGMIRSTAFSLLRFREDWRKERSGDIRNIIICFEEPELFLHPNAANQMRDTIYELTNNENQIICTSHSPYMIDLSREQENQIVSSLSVFDDGYVHANPFSVTEKYLSLVGEDKSYVKLLLKIDDYIARAFFCKRVIIVEGDTEDILLRRTISLVVDEKRRRILSEVQVIKARGKATITPLIHYFSALGITNVRVIHDKDTGKEHAEVFNPLILAALQGDESKRCMLVDCVEDVLGYIAPSKEKPYKAFSFSEEWKTYQDMPAQWRSVVEQVFDSYL